MKERPILMSAPMVRAILEGRKTQTRRAIKPQPVVDKHPPVWGREESVQWHAGRPLVRIGHECGYIHTNESVARRIMEQCSPYGKPGDRLWVREAWAVDAPLDEVKREREDMMGPSGFGHGPYFRADLVHENAGFTWRPSIHLPRWASRITLEVVDVRAERLHEISEADAWAEGVLVHATPLETVVDDPHAAFVPAGRQAYSELWDNINGKGSWGANPWVWVVSFKRCG